MTEPRRADVPLMTNGRPNPTGRGRYCAPNRCYCGDCPSWSPLPPIDWDRVKRDLREAERRKREKRQQFVPTRKDW